MTQEQAERLQKVKDKIAELQNQCNRAQEFANFADQAGTDETAEAFIKEAELSFASV